MKRIKPIKIYKEIELWISFGMSNPILDIGWTYSSRECWDVELSILKLKFTIIDLTNLPF